MANNKLLTTASWILQFVGLTTFLGWASGAIGLLVVFVFLISGWIEGIPWWQQAIFFIAIFILATSIATASWRELAPIIRGWIPKPGAATEAFSEAEEIVEFDPHRHMFSKIMRVDVNGLWTEHAPFIEFIVYVRQTSGLQVTLTDVQGRTQIGGIETDQPPRLVRSPTSLPTPNDWYDCTIRQHVPQTLALELISHPGKLNLWGEDAEVTFSLAGLKWVGSVGDIPLPETVVLERAFTILGPVREQDGDKVLWATNTVVVSQVHRQQGTGALRKES